VRRRELPEAVHHLVDNRPERAALDAELRRDGGLVANGDLAVLDPGRPAAVDVPRALAAPAPRQTSPATSRPTLSDLRMKMVMG